MRMEKRASRSGWSTGGTATSAVAVLTRGRMLPEVIVWVRLTSSVATDHDHHGPGQDLQVEPEGAVLDVEEVVAGLVSGGGVIPAPHLGQAGNARADVVACRV